MVAADQGDSEALKLLLEAGANINCRVSNKMLTFYFGDHYLLKLSVTNITIVALIKIKVEFLNIGI